jgi:DNA-binding NarL/FixJ family response regulator
MVEKVRVDVALVDAKEPAALLLVSSFAAAEPAVRILAVSASEDDTFTAAALASGACGVVVRSLPPEALGGLLGRVVAGELVLPDAHLRTLLEEVDGAERSVSALERLASLTAREREVLTLLAEGRSTVDVAAQLGITRGTVQMHMKSVFWKLGVHSKVEAIRLAWRHGTVAVPA